MTTSNRTAAYTAGPPENSTTTGDANQPPGPLELEVRDDVFHDRAGADRPFLRMLVVRVHMPIIQSLVARPEAYLVVPSRVLGMCPPGKMEKTRQSLQVMPYISEDNLELLIII